MSVERLEKFIKDKKINCKILKFDLPVITSEQAKKVVNGKIVKTIMCMLDNEPYLFVLFGEDKINFEKVKNYLKVKEVRLAKAKEVREITGYDIGELPPFSLNMKVCVDKKLLNYEDETVYCGGGTHYSLIEIKIKDLISAIENPIIFDFSL